MSDLDDIIRDSGIDIRLRPGERGYALCPACSAGRATPAHRTSKVLAVTAAHDGKSFAAICNHCGETYGGRVGGKRQQSESKSKSKSNGNGGGNGHDASSGGPNVVATYDYVDENNLLLFQVCRTAEKQFPQRHLLASGQWKWGVPSDVRRVPYRLPELLASVAAGNIVVLLEGEKDVNAAQRLGVSATCSPGGASEPGKKQKWRAEYNQFFRGAHVVIVPDNDPPGYALAEDIARNLRRVARRVCILKLVDHWPELSEEKLGKTGGDLSDGLDAGRTGEEFVALVCDCPDWVDPSSKLLLARFTDMETLQTKEFPPVQMVIPKYLAEGLTLLAGRPKVGKSFWALNAALSVSRGSKFMGEQCERGSTFYLALEDPEWRVQSRVTAMLGAFTDKWPSNCKVTTGWKRLDQGGLDDLWTLVEAARPRLVVLDILARVKPRRDKEDDAYATDYDFVAQLSEITKLHKMGLLCLTHQRKASSDYEVDTISGTLGQAGGVDQVLLLEKKSDGGFSLRGVGRDIEPFHVGMSFDSNHNWWEYTGEAAPETKSQQRGAVLAVLMATQGTMTTQEIADAMKTSVTPALRMMLSRMVSDGELLRPSQGKFCIPPDTLV